VLDTEPLEDLHRAVVHERGYRDDELSLGVAEDLAHAVVEADLLGGAVELPLRDLEGVQALLDHGSGPPAAALEGATRGDSRRAPRGRQTRPSLVGYDGGLREER
jgi:hypothetical protein